MLKTILIIEDERPLVEAMSEYLTSEGYKVEVALNGNMAVEKTAQVKPDLILLDIVMPGMDGISYLKKIRAGDSSAKDTPVIIFTNLVGEKKWIEDMGLRITDYVVKANSSLKDLGERLKKILG